MLAPPVATMYAGGKMNLNDAGGMIETHNIYPWLEPS